MKVLVAGAGSVGAFFGGRLAQSGEDVFLLARGAHLEAMRRDGLEIRSPGQTDRIRVRAGDRPPAGETAEFVLVAAKTYQNEAIAEAISPAVGPGTRIASLQNGIGNEEFFGARFDAGRIIGGVARIGTEVVAPGVVEQSADADVVFGDFPRGEGPGTARLVGIFAHAGLSCRSTGNIVRELWEKLLANAVFNCLQTLHGCTLDAFLAGERRAQAERALAELHAVAGAQGIRLRPGAVEKCWEFCRRWPGFRSSTYQDFLRGRPLEIDAFNGAIVEAGERTGVPTPEHRHILDGLRRLRKREPGGAGAGI